ncbi:MAG: ABC transporter permease, partial [Chloroflexota bacterium]
MMSSVATPLEPAAAPATVRRFELGTVLMWLLLIVIAVFTVTPAGVIVISAVRDNAPGREGTWTLQGLTSAVNDPVTWSIAWTTLWLALVRVAGALSVAVTLSWILARTNCPFRSQLEFLVVLSFFFPALGKLLTWTVLASPQTGYLNQLIRLLPFVSLDRGPIDIYSYGGVIFASVIGIAPFLTVFMLPAFRAMDASLEESAQVCGASPRRTLSSITFPLMRPAIMSAFILALLLMLSSFETEVFLGTQAGIFVFTNKIYQQLNEVVPANYPAAFTLAFMLLMMALILVVINWRMVGNRSYTTVGGRSYSARTIQLGVLRWPAFAIVATFLFLGLLLPVVVLIQSSFMRTAGVNLFSANGYTLDNWLTVLTLRLPQTALMNTLILCVASSTIGMLVASLVAYVCTRTQFRGRKALEVAAWLPWGMPSLVLGLGMLWAVLFSPMSALYGTLAILVIAHVIRSMPVKTRIMTSTIVQIDKELEESARVLGASWPQAFRQIVLPLVKNGFVAGWIIGFVYSFGELALVAFLTGPKSVVYSTLLFSFWQNGAVERASVVAIIMTVIILGCVMLTRKLTRTELRS